MEIKEKRFWTLLGTLTVLSLILLVSVSCYVYKREHHFVQPAFEAEAEWGEPHPEEALVSVEVEEGFSARLKGELELKEETTEIWLTSPEENKVWMKLRIYDENEKLLGESGILKPGQYVRSISFRKEPKQSQPVVLKLMGYTPETWHSAGAAVFHTVLKVEG